MTKRVLSMDIAATTGWAFLFGRKGSKLRYDLIKVPSKYSEAARLTYFREHLVKLLAVVKPTHIVMEDVYSGKNVKTMKLLSKFAGVAEECCMSKTGIDPYIIHNSTVKAYFKAKNKRQLFDVVVSFLGWENRKLVFSKHNDIIDATAQIICFYDKILGVKDFRYIKDYGYLYNIQGL